MDKITDSIWIGNYVDAASQFALRKAGINAILCLDGCMAGQHPAEVGVERLEVIELIDGAGNSPEKFLRAVRLLKQLVSEHTPVLVHCHAGQSRSAVVVCKYFMEEEGKSLAEAMKQITSKRKVTITSGLQEALGF
jgi:protein-tyrosine phosphatase